MTEARRVLPCKGLFTLAIHGGSAALNFSAESFPNEVICKCQRMTQRFVLQVHCNECDAFRPGDCSVSI